MWFFFSIITIFIHRSQLLPKAFPSRPAFSRAFPLRCISAVASARRNVSSYPPFEELWVGAIAYSPTPRERRAEVSLRVDLLATKVAAPPVLPLLLPLGNATPSTERYPSRGVATRGGGGGGRGGARRGEGVGVDDEGKGTEGVGRVDRQLDMDFTI